MDRTSSIYYHVNRLYYIGFFFYHFSTLFGLIICMQPYWTSWTVHLRCYDPFYSLLSTYFTVYTELYKNCFVGMLCIVPPFSHLNKKNVIKAIETEK